MPEACCGEGPSSPHPVDSRQTRTVANARKRRQRDTQERCAGSIDNVAPAVLGPGRVVMTQLLRLLLAEAHGLDPVVRDALQFERLEDNFGAALSQGEVVLGAAAFVRIALDPNLQSRMLAKVVGVRDDHAARFRSQCRLVEVIVHAALRWPRSRHRRLQRRGNGRTRRLLNFWLLTRLWRAIAASLRLRRIMRAPRQEQGESEHITESQAADISHRSIHKVVDAGRILLFLYLRKYNYPPGSGQGGRACNRLI